MPAPDGKTLRKLGCESLCLGAPSAVAEACVADDMDAVIPPFWLPRMLTVSVGGTVVLRVHVAFGPLDGATPGDSSLVRLRARLSADGLGVEITDDPGRSCTAAKKNPDYAAGLPYRAAVDRVCAARGRYAWTNGRFVRAP